MRRILIFILAFVACWFADDVAHASNVSAPSHAVAGSKVSLPTSGSGSATLYVFGPGTAIKKDVQLGNDVDLAFNRAGRYTAIVNGDAVTFDVVPAAASEVAFLARPSRVPVDRRDVVAGTVFLFDHNRNLVTTPTPVKFDLTVAGGQPQTRSVQSKNGVAYIKLDSGRKAGPAQFVATVGQTSVRRVVTETASDPCNLRIHAKPTKDGLTVETDPVKDCAGNPVPDGTIVTIMATSPKGRSTVDARVKKGIAKAELPPMQNATLSVAAGVVVGNEIHVGGGM
ncbi:MAG: hypothetical protein ACXVZX_10945 [Terriglobales bacterium]